MIVAIIGKGSIGKRHGQNLKKIGHEVLYVRTKKSKRRDEISFLEISNKIDFFIISNPTSLHLSTVQKIEKFKKPILVEKPLAHKYNLYQKKLSRNENIFVGYQMRYDPRINFLKKLIQKNKKYYANITWLTNMPNWHKNEDYFQSYASKKSLGGGASLTLSHEIDLAYYIFGKVKSVSIVKLKNTLKIDVEDKILICLKHYNGSVSNLYLNFASKYSERKIEVYDTKSKLIYDFNKNYICKNTNFNKIKYKCPVKKNEIYLFEMIDFINSIKSDKKKNCRINIRNIFHTQTILNEVMKKIPMLKYNKIN
tara:strand:- start:10246 stop:11175 length:930 start_codon:yes stop_codon:yes gene_type:complete